MRCFIDATFGHSLGPGVSTGAGRGRSSPQFFRGAPGQLSNSLRKTSQIPGRYFGTVIIDFDVRAEMQRAASVLLVLVLGSICPCVQGSAIATKAQAQGSAVATKAKPPKETLDDLYEHLSVSRQVSFEHIRFSYWHASVRCVEPCCHFLYECFVFVE